MTTLELDAVFSGALQGATLSVPAGLTVVIGTPEDGGAELPLVLGGLVAPRRGAVRVAGRDPSRTPDVRAKLGLVLADEPPLESRTVTEGLRQAMALRGLREEPSALLERRGLAAWGAAEPSRLGAEARRQLAWALALAISEPLALIVHEPLAFGVRERTCEELHACAARGVPVLVVTASLRDASELGGSVVLLDRGRFVRRPGVPLAPELVPGAAATLFVSTPGARVLAAALAGDAAVTAVDWDDTLAPEQLRVRGPDVDRLSLAVLKHARELGVTLHSLSLALPAMEEVRAATAGLWRAAYDSALRTATAQAREREEALARQRAASAPPAPPPPPPETEGGAAP